MQRRRLGARLFVAVADSRGFTRAGAALGVSTLALSHAMRELEAGRDRLMGNPVIDQGDDFKAPRPR